MSIHTPQHGCHYGNRKGYPTHMHFKNKTFWDMCIYVCMCEIPLILLVLIGLHGAAYAVTTFSTTCTLKIDLYTY